MKSIEQKIAELNDDEKLSLVEKIWDSIAAKENIFLTTQKKQELDARMHLIESGEAVFLSVEEIKQRFQALK
jgi:putative addiction module component (TIGR02574 family)